jgi:hypothetical protein
MKVSSVEKVVVASSVAVCLLSASAASAADAKKEEVPESGPTATKSILYTQGGMGISYVDMATFNSSDFAVARAGGAGTMFDAGLGVRLVVFTIGPRLRYHSLSSFDLWQLNGEVGLHVPVGDWDGHLGLHGGCGFVGRLEASALPSSLRSAPARDVRITGWDAGLQLGLDRYFGKWFSVGADVSGDVLVMQRPAVATIDDPQYGKDGGAIGFAIVGGLHAGVHF